MLSKPSAFPKEDAKICVYVLLEGDRRGIESHGCNRFKPIYIDRINAGIQKPVTDFEVIKDTPTTLVADAHDGMGMVASYKAMNAIIEKAKKFWNGHGSGTQLHPFWHCWLLGYHG